MNKTIYILTDYRGLYRQGVSRYRGIDLDVFCGVLNNAGFQTIRVNYSDINRPSVPRIKDSYVFYTSSESHEYQDYIKAIIYDLSKYNTLIPGYDMLMCHEDKCYQELFKNKVGFSDLRSIILGGYKELIQFEATGGLHDIKYPVVVKKYRGAGSISVKKAENYNELLRIIKSINRNAEYLIYHAKKVYKKMKRNLDTEYDLDDMYLGRFIIQEYVPDLLNDWKVLVFGDKFYALYRGVRDNDFRASGSGKFKFERPSDDILNAANDIYRLFRVPFLSLDLCQDTDGKIHLIEFQGLHFGPYTLVASSGYYKKSIIEDSFCTDNESNAGSCWHYIEGKSNLSEEYANAVIKYLDKRVSE